MLNWIKKQSISAWICLGAAVLALIAMILYIQNSTTGIMQTVPLKTLAIWFSAISVVLLAALFAIGDRLPHWIVSIVMLVAVVFLTVSICSLINNRTDIAGDQWFIPGMDTPEKGACLSGAITCIVFWVLSIAAVIVAAFFGRSEKR